MLDDNNCNNNDVLLARHELGYLDESVNLTNYMLELIHTPNPGWLDMS